jgi:hypothetical protein
LTTTQCCANCTGAIKLETVIKSTCKSNRSFPNGKWREWLDAPFAENDCDHFAPLSAGELQRRAEMRANGNKGMQE